jgi:hypothetical protein
MKFAFFGTPSSDALDRFAHLIGTALEGVGFSASNGDAQDANLVISLLDLDDPTPFRRRGKGTYVVGVFERAEHPEPIEESLRADYPQLLRGLANLVLDYVPSGRAGSGSGRAGRGSGYSGRTGRGSERGSGNGSGCTGCGSGRTGGASGARGSHGGTCSQVSASGCGQGSDSGKDDPGSRQGCRPGQGRSAQAGRDLDHRGSRDGAYPGSKAHGGGPRQELIALALQAPGCSKRTHCAGSWAPPRPQCLARGRRDCV